MRFKGSLHGVLVDPTQFVAKGVWSLQEHADYRRRNVWPFAGVGDALDPATLGSGISLSNANRQAINSDTSWGNVRGVTSRSSGKWYYEVEVLNDSGGGYLMFGIDVTGANSNTYHGANASGFGYQSNAQKWTNNGSASYGDPWTTGAVIGIALDFDAGTISYLKNNVSQGVAHSSVAGTFYPCISMYGSGQEVLCRFQAAHFIYSPPASHSAWVAG